MFADEAQSLDYLPSVESTTFGPGEYYDYLNPSFILIANVVEQLTGEDFYKYMTDSIFTPAGMTHTYYFDPGTMVRAKPCLRTRRRRTMERI